MGIAERIAVGILQWQGTHGPFHTTQHFTNALGQLMPNFAHEYPRASLQLAVCTAIRIFLNQEAEQLDVLLYSAFEMLEFYGRLVLLTSSKREQVAVRRFLRDHEEPCPALV